jgi:hypothetical protein
MVSTDAGIQIDSSDEHPAKAQQPMEESLEPDSNVTLITL